MKNRSDFILMMILTGMIVLTAFLTGCQNGGSSERTAVEDTVEDVVEDVVEETVLETTDSEVMQMAFGGLTRSYRLHLPDAYDSTSKFYPLVLVLHGGFGDGEKIEQTSGMSEKADQEGFIAVYPDGTGLLKEMYAWNVGFCCGNAYEEDVDDVGFIYALISELENNYNIDSEKIYIAGFSNGGMMTYRLGAEFSDMIASIAVVSGAGGGKYTEDSTRYVMPEPKDTVSVIHFHGMADDIVPYEGGVPGRPVSGEAYSYISVNESLDHWIQYNECITDATEEIIADGNITIQTYSGGRNSTEVILYTILDGTHSWPGSQGDVNSEEIPNYDISATDLMWDFFVSHPKNN